MDTRFYYIDEALQAIVRREESIGRILTSETGFDIFCRTSRKRFQRIYELRNKLYDKRQHYLDCENMIIDIM